jgi:hypothetical protein
MAAGTHGSHAELLKALHNSSSLSPLDNVAAHTSNKTGTTSQGEQSSFIASCDGRFIGVTP